MYMEPSNYGTVIILNGTSSSGKTTLALELQHRLEETYLHCSSDTFWNMTPASIAASSVTFPNLKSAMALSVEALAKTGHNVIVDTIYLGRKTEQEMNTALRDIKKFVIKLDCSLETLKAREKERGDRSIGLAQSQFETVHKGISYDLEIDTSMNTPNDCAAKVIAFLKIQKS